MLHKNDEKIVFNPLESPEGIQIIGWQCTLEIRQNEEKLGLGFTRNVRDENETITYIRKWKTESKDIGFMIINLLNANNEKQLRKWKIKHGADTPLQKLKEAAQEIKHALFLKKDPKLLWETIAKKAYENPIKIIGYDQSYIVTSEEIMSLVYYEIMEIIRTGKIIEKCYCGKYYIPLTRQRKNHCIACDPPSQRKKIHLSENELIKRREETAKRVKKWRKEKKKTAQENRAKILRETYF